MADTDVSIEDVAAASKFLQQFLGEVIPDGDFTEGTPNHDFLMRGFGYMFAYMRKKISAVRDRGSLLTLRNLPTTSPWPTPRTPSWPTCSASAGGPVRPRLAPTRLPPAHHGARAAACPVLQDDGSRLLPGPGIGPTHQPRTARTPARFDRAHHWVLGHDPGQGSPHRIGVQLPGGDVQRLRPVQRVAPSGREPHPHLGRPGRRHQRQLHRHGGYQPVLPQHVQPALQPRDAPERIPRQRQRGVHGGPR
jgi:hypothetical protein